MPNIYVANSSTKTTFSQVDVKNSMSDNTFLDTIVNMCCFRVKITLHDWPFLTVSGSPYFFIAPFFKASGGVGQFKKNVPQTDLHNTSLNQYKYHLFVCV